MTQPRLPRPARRPASLDLSRKSALVSRPDPFSRGSRLLVRWARRVWRISGLLAAVGLTFLLGWGTDRASDWVIPAGAFAAVVLAHRLAGRLRSSQLGAGKGAWGRLVDHELAVLAVATTYLALDLTGGPASLLYPAMYLVVALVVISHAPAVAFGAVATALALEALVAWRAGILLTDPTEVAAHGAYVTGFAVLYHLSLSGKFALVNHKARAEVSAHLLDVRERARLYRLVLPAHDGEDAAAAEDKWLLASVEQVDDAVRSVLGLVQTLLDTHTVGVWMLTSDEEGLRLHDSLSASDRLSRRRLNAAEGLPGVVLKRRTPVRLGGSFHGAIYYEDGPQPGAFLGVPILEPAPGGHAYVRGVLLADRLEDRPFTEKDEQVLEGVAGEIHRAMHMERLLGRVRREKEEKDRFYRAIEHLNVLSKTSEICQAVLRLTQEIAAVDAVAVTLVEESAEGGLFHRVVEAAGEGTEGWAELEYEDNGGLVAQTVRYGTAMPGRPFHEMERPVVFDAATRVKGLGTLKVLPMIAGEQVVGTVVCGARARRALDHDAVRRLGVVAMQAAGAIQRGRLFEQTERMATTDGLTGLWNHRRFQERFDEILASASRYDRPVSLLLTDVDHFKSVNDTYGHPVGDVVLKGVARILRSEARDADVVARYGGEEFAVILPETTPSGAMSIAERIRKRIEREVFRTELGPLNVTLSLGVAAYPNDGDHKQALVERADQALYVAKRGGRNQVVRADRFEDRGDAAA